MMWKNPLTDLTVLYGFDIFPVLRVAFFTEGECCLDSLECAPATFLSSSSLTLLQPTVLIVYFPINSYKIFCLSEKNLLNIKISQKKEERSIVNGKLFSPFSTYLSLTNPFLDIVKIFIFD